jgi:hypothetical protein
MSWNEQAHSVTRAFDDWALTDRDIRAFLKISDQFVQKEYERIWNELANSPGDPDGPELPDLFNDAVDGLWPSDYEWMLLPSVVKDGVTAFEVYLEKAANEVRKVHGWGIWRVRGAFSTGATSGTSIRSTWASASTAPRSSASGSCVTCWRTAEGSFGPRPTGRRSATRPTSSRRARRSCPRAR